jgi:hypothetical protein
VKTGAPKGETLVLQSSFTWKQLSRIAGVSFWRLYFRFFPGTIKAPQIVEFLKALKAQPSPPAHPLDRLVVRAAGCANNSNRSEATSRSSSCWPMPRN